MTQPEAVRPLIDSGMARQLEAFHARVAAGMPRLGWKIGINDPAAQQRLGLDATLVGWLDGERVFETGQAYRTSAGAKPRVEAEIAVRLGAEVPVGSSVGVARSAIAAIAPAIEFVNGTKPLSPLDELLAHDILHDGVLFGAESDLSLAANLSAPAFPVVTRAGDDPRRAIAGRYPDDLAEIVAHTANVLGHYGESLRAGDRIICGSFIDPFDISPGDRIDVDFGPLGSLTFNAG